MYREIVVTDEIVGEINREHDLFQQSMRTGLEHAIRCGQLLIDAKGMTEWGNWINWIRENCSFSENMAQKYMRLATNKERIPHLENVNSIGSALRCLYDQNKLTKPQPELQLEIEAPFSWINDEDVIAMQDGIKAIQRCIPKLKKTTVDEGVANYLLEMTHKSLVAIVKEIERG